MNQPNWPKKSDTITVNADQLVTYLWALETIGWLRREISAQKMKNGYDGQTILRFSKFYFSKLNGTNRKAIREYFKSCGWVVKFTRTNITIRAEEIA